MNERFLLYISFFDVYVGGQANRCVSIYSLLISVGEVRPTHVL